MTSNAMLINEKKSVYMSRDIRHRHTTYILLSISLFCRNNLIRIFSTLETYIVRHTTRDIQIGHTTDIHCMSTNFGGFLNG